jgi:DNA-binding LytR/AlgR family response regulator
MKALIIDDEPLAHEVILKYAEEVDFLEIVGQCYLATEALTFLKNESVDLLFLDINMPKIKGLDFLRTLNKKPIVIITSAYQEYALESFELDVSDYLLKPFRLTRFLKAINKVEALLELKKSAAENTSENQEVTSNQLFVKSDKRYIQVNLEEVFYLESYGNYVKIWQKDNFILTPNTLSNFETQLPNSDFYRIHKSYIVHRKHIDYVEGNFVMLTNKTQLPIGKSQKSDFKNFIQSK